MANMMEMQRKCAHINWDKMKDIILSGYKKESDYCEKEERYSLPYFFLSTPSSLFLEVLKYMSEVLITRRGGGSGSSVGAIKHVMEVITTNKTWTVPANIASTSIDVRIFGGGGAGAGSGAGAGGGWMNNAILTLAAGTQVAIKIGAGGTGNDGKGKGNSGGTTTFGSYLSANGGEGSYGYRGVYRAGNGGNYCGGGGGFGGQGGDGAYCLYGANMVSNRLNNVQEVVGGGGGGYMSKGGRGYLHWSHASSSFGGGGGGGGYFADGGEGDTQCGGGGGSYGPGASGNKHVAGFGGGGAGKDRYNNGGQGICIIQYYAKG